MRNQGRSTTESRGKGGNTKEQTQSRISHRLSAHSYHKEPKQEHTESRSHESSESKPRAGGYADKEHTHSTRNQSRSTLSIKAPWK
jgi:hypothetical protein